MSVWATTKGLTGQTWLAAGRRLLLLCWLSLSVVVADGLGLTPEVMQWVKNEFGSAGVERLYSWQRFVESSRDKSEDEKLQLVNDFFNRLRYRTDMQLWGRNDYWATPVEALGKGGADCEDYSIAKYFTLRELGVPDEKMRIMYVKALELNAHHMVLTYYATPSAVPLVLDNLNSKILPASKRSDLAPIYSFNGSGLWLAKERGRGQRMGGSGRVKLWQDLKARMQRPLPKGVESK